jgi:hypothetical protein
MENKELTFNLTVEEANTILIALQEMPAKVANPLTAKLQQQAKPQLPKAENEVPNLETVS